jgi:hypothetical protein
MGKQISIRGGVIVEGLINLEQEIGMPIKRGKISLDRDKYYITIDEKPILLPVGTVILKEEIKSLKGKEVLAVFSLNKKYLIAIDAVPLPEKIKYTHKWILCYVPVPDIIKRIRDQIRNPLIQEMIAQEIITPEFARKVGLRG